MSPAKFNKANAYLKVVLIMMTMVSGSAAVFGNLYIRFHYATVMPRSPEPETGRIYPIAALYGGVVYVSQKEIKYRDFAEHELVYVFGAVMILNFGLGNYLGWWPSVRRSEIGKFYK